MTSAAIAAAVVHVISPNLEIDGITVVLLVVAVVPWLGDVFDSIELPGGAKFQYKQLADRIEETERRTTHLGQAVDGASRTARAAFRTAGGPLGREGLSDADAMEMVERLAAEYGGVRARDSSGPLRTYRMEQIFADLVTVTRRVHDFDIGGALGSDDPGSRLAGYARLYAIPDPDRLEALVEAVLAERLAFSQYWGFQSVGVLVDELGAHRVPDAIVEQLSECMSAIPSDSDRVVSLQSVLAKFDAATAVQGGVAGVAGPREVARGDQDVSVG